MAVIIFEIGDWSSDGHSISAQYLVRCNRTLDKMRELHFTQNETIGDMCKEYNDPYIDLEAFFQYLELLRDKNWALQELHELTEGGLKCVTLEDAKGKWIEHPTQDDLLNVKNRLHVDDSEGMLAVWLLMLRAIDPKLKVEVLTHGMSNYEVKYKGYPYEHVGTMHFYGVDDKGRHLYTPGYGVWQGDEMEYCHGV